MTTNTTSATDATMIRSVVLVSPILSVLKVVCKMLNGMRDLIITVAEYSVSNEVVAMQYEMKGQWPAAFIHFNNAMEYDGSPTAMYKVAMYHLWGFNVCPINRQLAVKLLKRASHLGIDGFNKLTSRPVPVNSMKLLLPATPLSTPQDKADCFADDFCGHVASAQSLLAECLWHGWGLLADRRKAVIMWSLNADDCYSKRSLAFRLFHGRFGATQDRKRAQELFDLAIPELHELAARGDPRAQYHLGTLYRDGRAIITVDLARARNFYLAAAEQGHCQAQNELGVLLETGSPHEYQEALKWYLAAATQGMIAAMHNVGGYADTGRGMRRDPYVALKWYQAAADGGSTEPDLKSVLERLKQELHKATESVGLTVVDCANPHHVDQ